MSGPMTASNAGTLATATPNTAGSACLAPCTSATLKMTRPVTATDPSHSHSAPRGFSTGRPDTRASTRRIAQAIVYRKLSAR